MTPTLSFGETFSKCGESNKKITLTFEQIDLIGEKCSISLS